MVLVKEKLGYYLRYRYLTENLIICQLSAIFWNEFHPTFEG